jgi:hypothetical protein
MAQVAEEAQAGRELFLGSSGKVSIQLDGPDAAKWREACERDTQECGLRDGGVYCDPFVWIEVTDQVTGNHWKVAPASCSAACRCAAVGEEVQG